MGGSGWAGRRHGSGWRLAGRTTTWCRCGGRFGGRRVFGGANGRHREAARRIAAVQTSGGEGDGLVGSALRSLYDTNADPRVAGRFERRSSCSTTQTPATESRGGFERRCGSSTTKTPTTRRPGGFVRVVVALRHKRRPPSRAAGSSGVVVALRHERRPRSRGAGCTALWSLIDASRPRRVAPALWSLIAPSRPAYPAPLNAAVPCPQTARVVHQVPPAL